MFHKSSVLQLFHKTNLAAPSSPAKFLSDDINKNNTHIPLSDNYSTGHGNNNATLNANHLYSQSISIMTRSGQMSSNPLPAVGEASTLPPHRDAQATNSNISLETDHPLSPRGAIARQPGRGGLLPPLDTQQRPTPSAPAGGGFVSQSPSPRPSAPDYDMFQAKEWHLICCNSTPYREAPNHFFGFMSFYMIYASSISKGKNELITMDSTCIELW